MDNPASDSLLGKSRVVVEKKRHSFLVDLLIRLVKEKPLGTVGAVITLLLLFTGIFAEFLAPYGANETSTADILLAPSPKYLLGTDNLGRDLLSRIIFGARISLIVGISAATVSTILSTIIGTISGYLGGKLDMVVQRVVDSVMCIPGLILLMVLVSIIQQGMFQIIIAIGITLGLGGGSRVVRSAVLSIKENVYIEAAVAVGCSIPRLLTRHILPNIAAPIIVLFTTQMPGIILMEASLSFLGFGIPPPAVSWGGMLSGSGRQYMFLAPWMAIWPGLALATVVYGVNIFGDAVRDLLDPKLRGGVGRYEVGMKKKLKLRSEPEKA